ncbi:Cobalt-zinc-cadmium resistance protein CzcB [bacterium HR37]|jgi:cobalt-zinc-cadmium efflux system membrane fusion protein|nr:Cobalt-zinc-cadmium resistance protein CzcB [bacterium HR37]
MKKILISSLVIASFLILTVIALRQPNQKKTLETEKAMEHTYKEDTVELSREALQTLPLKIAVVKRRDTKKEIQTTAVIEFNKDRIAHVTPRIPGRVIKVNALLGDNVKKGQILAELDSIELGKAKAEYLKAKADYAIALANYKREKRLFNQKISSEKEYLEAKGEYMRSKARLKSAYETLRLLGLNGKEIKELSWEEKNHPLSHFPLLAPFTGKVVEKHIVLGEFITPEDKPYTIADLSRLWIQLDIYEKDLRWVRPGTEVHIRVDAYPDERFQGIVTYISDTLDKATRTAKARVEIENHDEKLKPGMFAKASIFIPIPDTTRAITIPTSAIYNVYGKPVVFVQEGERTFKVREIKLGQNSGPYIEVLDGLKEGEKIVIEGGFHLKSALLKEELGEEHAH